MIAISMAVLHAAAAARAPCRCGDTSRTGGRCSLPLPQIQIFGGGAHAGRRVDVQDFMVDGAGAAAFAEALEMTAEVYRAAGELMAGAGPAGRRRRRRRLVAELRRATRRRWRRWCSAIERPASCPARRSSISLDIAASEFGRDGRYRLALETQRARHATAGRACCCGWIERYPIVSIEDPLAEDDAAGLARSRAPSATGSRSSATTIWSPMRRA